jgi:hypothetical protein
MNNYSLFSIDVNSHLEKAAKHTFGSSSHYPVELVRAALKREANKINVHINHNKICIQDNGSGMDRASIETLITLLDPSKSTSQKEEAVEKMQTHNGFGLLAIFASSPEKILIENVSSYGKTQILFKNNIIKKNRYCNLNTGTRITIFSRRNQNILREKQILKIYCKSAQIDILLNNCLISKKPVFSHHIAVLKIEKSKNNTQVQVAIPESGNLCIIRLFDMGIPYSYFSLPPKNGFIFDAAIEYSGEITENQIRPLTEHTYNLYKWLCDNYNSFPLNIKERTEELIFTHYRSTGDTSFINDFSAFKKFKSEKTLCISQIIQEAKFHPIFAVLKNKEHLNYNTCNHFVLSLTQNQGDILINLLNIPITFLSPGFKKKKSFFKFYSLFKKSLKYITLNLFIIIPSMKIIKSEHLSFSEQFFLNTLNKYISQNNEHLFNNIHAYMIESTLPFLSLCPKKFFKKSIKQKLLINRNHSIVKKTIYAIEKNPANMEMFIPLINR